MFHLPNVSGRLQTIQFRHLDVHQHQVELFPLQNGDRFPAGAGHLYVMPFPLEHLAAKRERAVSCAGIARSGSYFVESSSAFRKSARARERSFIFS